MATAEFRDGRFEFPDALDWETWGLGGWRQLNSYKVRVLLGWLVSLGCLGHSALRSVARRARPLGGVL